MKKDQLLLEAKKYKDDGNYPNALANLHQLDNKYPNNELINYLLASTYFEAHNLDLGLEYCDKTLTINENSKEALELKGIILKKNGDFGESEKLFLKVLELDPNMFCTRKHLASLYYFCTKELEKGEEQCKYILEKRDTERDTLSKQKKKKVAIWLNAIAWIYRCGLIFQEKYTEAAEITLYNSLFLASIYGASTYKSDEVEIYQLFFLGGDQDKILTQEDRIRDLFKTTDIQLKSYRERAGIKKTNIPEGEPPIVYMN